MKPLTPALLIAEVLLLRVLWGALQPVAATLSAPTQQIVTAQTCHDLLPASVQLYSGIEFGSGGIVSPDGLIVTALHVVKAGNVRVRHGADLLDGKVIATDPQHDLAIVSVQSSKALPVVLLGGQVEKGAVCSIGNSGNRTGVRQGRVTAKEANQVVTNLAARPGDSGGMVVQGGKLVGVTRAMGFDATGKPTNVTYAVSVERVRELMSKQEKTK